MDRRDTVLALLALGAAPLAAEAQQAAKVARIGYLSPNLAADPIVPTGSRAVRTARPSRSTKHKAPR